MKLIFTIISPIPPCTLFSPLQRLILSFTHPSGVGAVQPCRPRSQLYAQATHAYCLLPSHFLRAWCVCCRQTVAIVIIILFPSDNAFCVPVCHSISRTVEVGCVRMWSCRTQGKVTLAVSFIGPTVTPCPPSSPAASNGLLIHRHVL